MLPTDNQQIVIPQVTNKPNKKNIPMPLLVGIIAVIIIAVIAIIIAGNKKPSAPTAKPQTTVSTTVNTTAETTTKPSTTEQTTKKAEPVQKSWQDLYHSKLDELEQKFSENSILASYALYDMNMDSIPELIVSYGNSYADNVVEFYTVQNSQLVSLGDHFSGNCEIEVVDGELYINYQHMGNQEIYQVTIQDNKIDVTSIYQTNGEDEYRIMGDLLEFFEFESEYSPFSAYEEE